MSVTKLTVEQAVIVSAYTGILICEFHLVHEAIEKKFGRPVFVHEMPELEEEIRELFKDDFLALAP